jgi:uncharacterized protein (TIGR02271 family)
MEQNDVTGATLYDVDGDEVGRVERVYPDETGTVRFVRVKMGTLLAKHRVVPIDGTQPRDGKLTAPYTKEVIENSPELSDDVDPLSGMVAEDLRAYYGSGGGTTTTSVDNSPAAKPVHPSANAPVREESTRAADDTVPLAQSGEALGEAEGEGDVGQVRDLGDVVEIPITEERLVKQPVVKEVVRVRKNTVSDTRKVSAELRKEDVEVKTEEDVRVRENDET